MSYPPPSHYSPDVPLGDELHDTLSAALDRYEDSFGAAEAQHYTPEEINAVCKRIATARVWLSQDPDETTEGMTMLDLRDALKRIAYPANHPDTETLGLMSLDIWMQSVAARALTDAGTYNYERKAKP